MKLWLLQSFAQHPACLVLYSGLWCSRSQMSPLCQYCVRRRCGLELKIGNAEVYSVHQYKVRETGLETGRQIKFAVSLFPAPSCGSSKLVWLVLLRELAMITGYLLSIKRCFNQQYTFMGEKSLKRSNQIAFKKVTIHYKITLNHCPNTKIKACFHHTLELSIASCPWSIRTSRASDGPHL